MKSLQRNRPIISSRPFYGARRLKKLSLAQVPGKIEESQPEFGSFSLEEPRPHNRSDHSNSPNDKLATL